MNGLPAFMDGIMVLHVLLCFFFLVAAVVLQNAFSEIAVSTGNQSKGIWPSLLGTLT